MTFFLFLAVALIVVVGLLLGLSYHERCKWGWSATLGLSALVLPFIAGAIARDSVNDYPTLGNLMSLLSQLLVEYCVACLFATLLWVVILRIFGALATWWVNSGSSQLRST